MPAMHPGKRSRLALCQSDSLIQLPSWLLAPPAGTGTVSLWFSVTITVLLSTRATSLGSVRASQLSQNGTRCRWRRTEMKLFNSRTSEGWNAVYQLSYLGSFLTMPSFSRSARMRAVSSGVPVTTRTPLGLHSSAALFTKSATSGGSEGMEASDRSPGLTLTGPVLKQALRSRLGLYSCGSQVAAHRYFCTAHSAEDSTRRKNAE